MKSGFRAGFAVVRAAVQQLKALNVGILASDVKGEEMIQGRANMIDVCNSNEL